MAQNKEIAENRDRFVVSVVPCQGEGRGGLLFHSYFPLNWYTFKLPFTGVALLAGFDR